MEIRFKRNNKSLFKTTLICYICQTTKTDNRESSRISPAIRKLHGT